MKKEMTFEQFKNLDYRADTPLEYVLADVLYNQQLDINTVLSSYSHAIERDRQERKMRFEEACVNLTQLLSGNYRGKDLKDAQQRAIHTLDMSETFPHNIYHDKYDYTEETKKKWDEFCTMIYGMKL
jgi:hypothetical protein